MERETNQIIHQFQSGYKFICFILEYDRACWNILFPQTLFMNMELDLETLDVLLFQRSKGLERNLVPIVAVFYGIPFSRIQEVYRGHLAFKLAVKSHFLDIIIGIKHGFSCINIRQVPWEVLKTEAGGGLGFQHLPRDLANVTVMH